MTEYEKYRESILSVVLKAECPLAIETIRRKAGIKVWETTKALLLELMVEGKIAGLKTGKSWVFSNREKMNVISMAEVNSNDQS
ncbi:hypothetical protein JW988_02270 [Candidatus Bathyarchaeota archaeon]|nr:hypothetical protein [Candidatus Bathyarchaeota archaeon]